MKALYNLMLTEGVTPSGVPYVKVAGVYPFDAGSTFDCGQCFRFNETESGYPELYGTDRAYGGVAFGRYIKVISPDLDTLYIEGATAEDFDKIWYRYLGLDVNYAAIISQIREKWGCDSRLLRAAEAGRGIRIMAQDPWETLVSFIISQNNNIPRIKTIVERLCRTYGEHIGAAGEDAYSFPSPKMLYEADVDGLSATRMGFRAKYVFDAAEKFTFDPDFAVRVADAETYEAADELLRTVRGVGPKVSACTLLFGFGRLEAFPIDVWIRRTVGKYFDGKIPTADDFGELLPYAGILQQYIFNYERNFRED